MGDLGTLAKAKRELEEIYLGVPDDSVNLTFQDLAQVQQKIVEKRKSVKMVPTSEPKPRKEPLTKQPSLDFSRALQASTNNYHHHHIPDDTFDSPQIHLRHPLDDNGLHESGGRQNERGRTHGDHATAHGHHASPYHGPSRDAGFRHTAESSMAYDDTSHISGVSTNNFQERGGRRRPGIPHSNICTICSTYIYIFRHRCLVCGRAYCKQCVSVGMGEMTEGRKCVDCLGRKFSQRYIQRAGQTGCCMGYASIVKQQELKWAEKGPRRNAENRYGRSGMASGLRSPMTPITPTRAYATNGPPSFVVNTPSHYSNFSPTNHALPL